MPEGLTSIDDLKVVITAETEKMSQGLATASDLMSRFVGDSEAKLGKFDLSMAKVGQGLAALRGALGVWAAAATTALDVLEKMGDKAEFVAKKVGAQEEYNAFKDALMGIPVAINDLVQGMDSTTKSASFLKKEVADVSLSFDGMSFSATDLGKKALADLTEALERLSHEARRMTNPENWKVHTVDAEMDRLKRQIESTNELVNRATENGRTTILDRIIGVWSPWHRDNLLNLDELQKKLATLQSQLESMGDLRVKKQWSDVEVDTGGAELVKNLEREVDALRLRAAVLGMSAGEAAAFTAAEKIRQEALKTGKTIDEEATAALLGRMRAYHQQITGFAEAEREQRRAQQESERQDKGRDSLVEGLDRELSALKAKERGLGDVTAAVKAQEVEERALSQARQRNITVTDEMRLQIRAYANSIGEADVALRQHQKQLQTVQQGADIVFRGIETIISRSLDGSELKMRDVTASMLNSLSMLIMKMMVLKPLQESLFGGTGGGGILGSLFNFSGEQRAAGGPVTAGTTYLVGENGPELFTASNSGNIISNENLRGSGQSSQPVQVTVSTTIDARGAYPESIEEIKRALADQNARLPGRVLEVVGDARERGGLA